MKISATRLPREAVCLPRVFPQDKSICRNKLSPIQTYPESKQAKHIRDPESKKRYGRAWKRIRDRHIAQHPLCEVCKRNGRLTQAEEVHHILPLSHGGTHEDSNLMSLCKACHSKITAKDGDRWHNKSRIR